MTFEQWLTAQYALHTSYKEWNVVQQSDIKEYMQAAWEAGYDEGITSQRAYSQGYQDAMDDAKVGC